MGNLLLVVFPSVVLDAEHVTLPNSRRVKHIPTQCVPWAEIADTGRYEPHCSTYVPTDCDKRTGPHQAMEPAQRTLGLDRYFWKDA